VDPDGAAGAGTDSFRRLVERLSTRSVERRWEAYRDIDWDHPAMAVHREDPRWELPAWDPVGATGWYRDQAPARRAAIGLHRTAGVMKVAVDFEAGLQQGLVAFASTLPDGHPAFRYAYHEVTEEAQHSMMFQEFVRRAGFEVPASPRPMATNPTVPALARQLPALFFISVLSGEEPIDDIQRRVLRDPAPRHPLLLRINRIHCREEARHLSFARAYLHDGLARLGERDARRVAYEAPFLVHRMARRMTGVPAWFAARWGMPAEVHAAIEGGAEQARLLRSGTRGIHALCRREGMVPARVAPVWARLHLA
jgi:hypothetical protein